MEIVKSKPPSIQKMLKWHLILRFNFEWMFSLLKTFCNDETPWWAYDISVKVTAWKEHSPFLNLSIRKEIGYSRKESWGLGWESRKKYLKLKQKTTNKIRLGKTMLWFVYEVSPKGSCVEAWPLAGGSYHWEGDWIVRALISSMG
jgi:hypothetical protein